MSLSGTTSPMFILQRVAHDQILKVARTLADLDGVGNIEMQYLLEAVQYRTLDRKLLM